LYRRSPDFIMRAIAHTCPPAMGVPPRLSYATAEGRVDARGVWRAERLLTGGVSSAVAARAHCSVEVVRVA
jgi:nucleotide-binding universal stress UspA family protein